MLCLTVSFQQMQALNLSDSVDSSYGRQGEQRIKNFLDRTKLICYFKKGRRPCRRQQAPENRRKDNRLPRKSDK